MSTIALAFATNCLYSQGTAPQGTTLKIGVYECRAPRVGPAIGLQFGIADASHYTDYDQRGGTYTWNQGEQLLTFTSGPMNGLQRKWMDGTFRVIENGQITTMDCPYNGAKDPHKYHW